MSLQCDKSGNMVVSMLLSSLLHENRSSGKMAWRGSRKGTVKHSERSELSKKQHLAQALINQGLPEQEAVRQVDELLLMCGITKIHAKFDAFLWRQQMKSHQFPQHCNQLSSS